MARLQQQIESFGATRTRTFVCLWKRRCDKWATNVVREKDRLKSCMVETLPLQQTIKDTQKALQEAPEEWPKVVDIQKKEMQDFQCEIDRLENTNERRRASDAGSVQQGNTNTAFLQSSKICGVDERSSRRALCQNGVHASVQRWKKQRTNQKQEDGTQAQQQQMERIRSRHHHLSGDRLPVQSLLPNARGRSRSPVLHRTRRERMESEEGW